MVKSQAPRVGALGLSPGPGAEGRGEGAHVGSACTAEGAAGRGTAERRREAQDGAEHGEGALPLSGAPSHKLWHSRFA